MFSIFGLCFFSQFPASLKEIFGEIGKPDNEGGRDSGEAKVAVILLEQATQAVVGSRETLPCRDVAVRQNEKEGAKIKKIKYFRHQKHCFIDRRHGRRPCLVLFFFCKMDTVAFSFVFDKYYLIMD